MSIVFYIYIKVNFDTKKETRPQSVLHGVLHSIEFQGYFYKFKFRFITISAKGKPHKQAVFITLAYSCGFCFGASDGT